jgi:hypothetical protein
MSNTVSAGVVLYVKDTERVAQFYASLPGGAFLGLTILVLVAVVYWMMAAKK